MLIGDHLPHHEILDRAVDLLVSPIISAPSQRGGQVPFFSLARPVLRTTKYLKFCIFGANCSLTNVVRDIRLANACPSNTELSCLKLTLTSKKGWHA